MSNLNIAINHGLQEEAVDRPMILGSDLRKAAMRIEIERKQERKWLASALTEVFDDCYSEKELDEMMEN